MSIRPATRRCWRRRSTALSERVYTYGLQRIAESQIVNHAWTSSFYGYDGGGSVRQLTNLAGTVTDTYNYDAFGNLLNSTGTTPNNYLYRGEQYDSDLNRYYLRARYYNPATGRFMSRDPEGAKARNPRSLHQYLYADGDPVNASDPMGREALLETKLIKKFLAVPAVFAFRVVATTICLEFEVMDRLFLEPSGNGLPWPVMLPCDSYAMAEGLLLAIELANAPG